MRKGTTTNARPRPRINDHDIGNDLDDNLAGNIYFDNEVENDVFCHIIEAWHDFDQKVKGLRLPWDLNNEINVKE